MKVNSEMMNQIKELYEQYEVEVKTAVGNNHLSHQTARTYLLHSYNFIKWMNDDFVPGGRNK